MSQHIGSIGGTATYRANQPHKTRLAAIAAVIASIWAAPASAGVLTFSDQDGDSGPLSRGGNTANANTFTTAHGTPPGVTATP